jgi:ADP-heptose:LPS heptosyltransferase
MLQQNIQLVINLQNEGPQYDKNYYRFKEAHPGEFWELDFDAIYSAREPVHILDSTRTMLAAHDVQWWYPLRLPAERAGIAIYVGASELNKRWDAAGWVAVIQRLAVSYPSQDFCVLTGHSDAERSEATVIRQALLNCGNVDVVIETSLEDNLTRLSRVRLLVSHDTYPIHLASLLGIPAVGVYLSTDPIVWGSYDNPFTYVWSALNCGGRKQGTGNCVHFHTACPNIQQMRNAVSIDQVLKAIRYVLDEMTAQPTFC